MPGFRPAHVGYCRGARPEGCLGLSEELLGRLLAAWADTHDPALEDAIVRIGRGIARVRGPLEPARERDWNALVKGGVSNILLALRGAGISRVRAYAPRVRPAPDDPIAEATSSARAIPGITIEPGETFDLAAPA